MGAVGRAVLAVTLAGIAGLGPVVAAADGISDGVVKIGVLTDMSGQFSHESGEGAVTAVRMAIEDYGGKVLASRSSLWSPITRTNPTSPPALPANGSTLRTST